VSSNRQAVYTIGHSNHTLARFVDLLNVHRVTALADVRSAPVSRFQPQFNSKALEQSLGDAGITYFFLGAELGGRPKDPSSYIDGRIQYDLRAKTAEYRSGIERLMLLAAENCVSMMCAEREPMDCHRALLVGRTLDEKGAHVIHILADGSAEPHERTEDRLLEIVGSAQNDLIDCRDLLLDKAYRVQAERATQSSVKVRRAG
jgi:uncharacterized protein (DUF488 family)